MTFNTIITTETTNKTDQMATQVAEWLASSPEHTVFFIVPDHIKFTAELEMIQKVGHLLNPESEQVAVTRFQVYSFKRLAWYLLRDKAALKQPSLSPVGVSMLLQKILTQHQEEFILFRQEARHKGFIERLTSVMQEFHQGGIEVSDFERFFEAEVPSEVEQRLKEFGSIYRYYLEAMARDFVSSDVLLEELARVVREMDLSQTLVIVDQMYSLSSRELAVMEALASSCHRVDFHTSLTADGLRAESRGLFDSNRALVRRLLAWLFVESDVDVVREWHGVNGAYASDFVAMEDYWLQTSGGRSGGNISQDRQYLEHVHWTTYESESQEIVETLALMKQLVASGRYRYQDMQLLSRNLEAQEAFLRPMLAQYEIPAFIDLSDTMEHHPLVQVLDAIYAIGANYWRYADIMTLLRSEYAFWPVSEDDLATPNERLAAFRQDLDTTENIILAQGYEGYDWVSGRAWDYQEEAIDEESEEERVLSKTEQQLQQAQALRERMVTTLEPFYRQMDEAPSTAEALKRLYTLLEQIGVPTALLYWRDHAAERGDVEWARRQEQVWNEFLALLDEFVYIFGEEPFDWEIFQLLLHTGFEHTHYHLAPSTLDQVTVTGMDAVRFSPKKVTFAIGLAQGVLPRMVEESGLLTDEERMVLSAELDSGRFLNPTSLERGQVEPFIFYKVLTSATDELYLSVSGSRSGESLKPSSYVERLWRQFDCEKVDGAKRAKERVERGEFVTPYELFTVLLTQMRQYKLTPAEAIPALWLVLPHLLKQDSDWAETYHTLVDSVFKLNTAKPLPPELAAALYGNQLYLSTSQVEAYYKDPFSHFLQYGLRLQERREFELTPAGAGDYFHEAFDQFIKLMQERQLSLKEADDAVIEALLGEIFTKMTTDARFTILQSSPRMRFVESLLQDTLKKTLQAALLQLKELQVTPWKTEVQFGTHTDHPIEIPLGETQQLYLRGKIDRIDLLETPDHITMGIVDYKSSSQSFNINRLEAGIQLQLLTYMMIAKDLVEQERDLPVIPYAGLYMHVHQPRFQSADIKDLDQWAQKWQYDYRFKGLLTDDWNILQQVEPNYTQGSSLYLPFGRTKSGGYNQKQSTVIAPEDLEFLMEYAFRQIVLAGERILQGDTTLAPYDELKEFADSVTGKFSAISGFDATNPENRYRHLHTFKLQEGIDYLKNEGGDSE